MCECISKVENKVLDQIKKDKPTYDFEEIKSFSGNGFVNKTIPFSSNGLKSETVVLPMEFKYTFTKVDGSKSKERKLKTSMAMTYCPFCGNKLTED